MPYDPARDPLKGLASSLSSPARQLRLVVPSDTQDLDPYAKALWVYVAASVAGGVASIRITPVGAADGDFVTLYAPPGLLPLPPCQVRRVWATGSTATGLSVFALADR
ncbi:hypothetical protein EZH22_16985 [Xanthobacter dioxanivorans]|uniref:Uncharacterized protein n=1 Tax=Xanthobacter dioxanivorans TaxID=2528964 RepID=A0A974PJU5_9HYPH|nr:hypothetical protein [Xanthobacter dioxanivorans]QRG04844.1 hypothetical protein EZH22_16985 [Xanthobacter dioxanivorans]